MYFKKTAYQFIYVVLYFNDMLLPRNNKEIIKYVQDPLSSNFNMKYIGGTKKKEWAWKLKEIKQIGNYG